MPDREPRLPYILLPVAAFIAILPLILHGCSCGHDFDFHILNWLEAAHQFTHGNLHPHWAYTAAWNAGEPRFIFYPPLSWTIGAILGLILPWTWTPIAYTWLALTAAGLSLYYLAKEFTTPTAALIAAAFYIVNPYMLFTAYERTAYAELLAATWIPLLLHAILSEKITIPRIAIPVALLWLTNAPAAVMCCYTLALLTLIRLATNPGAPRPDSRTWVSRHSAHLQLAATTTTGTLLGLGLAAIYLLPAACERRYIQIAMAILPGMRIQDNFLFHHTYPGTQNDAFHDAVLHTASIIAVTLITLTVIAIAIAASRSKNPGAPYIDSDVWASRKARPLSSPNPETPGAPSFAHHAKGGNVQVSLAILTLTITFLVTPLSTPIWNHTPELLFLQFPWRFLAILAPVMSLAIATALSPVKLKRTAAIALALATALTAITYPIFRQPCDQEDTVQARLALFHSNLGTDPTDEYTPITADNDALAQTNPPYWLSQDPTAKAPTNSTPAQAPKHLDLTIPTPQTLILNLRDYPTWRITRNGAPITTRQNRDDGLIAIPIPAGESKIAITYIQPLDQTVGEILTAISLVLLLLTLRNRRSQNISVPQSPTP